MANYAFVEEGKIVGVYDLVPKNWRNVSNFYVLSDDELVNFGWYRLVKVTPEYDSNTQKLGNPVYTFENETAYETMTIVNIELAVEEPTTYQLSEKEVEDIRQREIQDQWIRVRQIRDELMKNFEWRYTRYERQLRLGINPADDLTKLDQYMQQLADITTFEDPFNIQWPAFLE